MPLARRGQLKHAPVRKNFRLDQTRLTAVKRALGARTETEAIETALDMVLFRKELVDGIDAMIGTQVEPFGD